ncbi:MAG: SIS domain-containing protein, partial [Clostridia bacterium]|nr:SIS domain-containing protein [Clostridia bacterium]
ISAKRVLAIGKDISGTLAESFARSLTLRGIDANYATERGLGLAYASHLTDKDVLLAFSRSGTTRDINDAIRTASLAGTTCALVCNNVTSPISTCCEYHFCTARVDDVQPVTGSETNTSQYALMKVMLYIIEKKLAREQLCF